MTIRLLYRETTPFFRNLESEPKVKAYLNHLRLHHKETYAHSCRVGLLSIDMGYENGFMNEYQRLLEFAGMLHDLGKVKIPRDILTKAGKLDEDEMALINGHPRLGFLELSDPEYGDVRQVVVGHHEYKKEPYPRKGSERRKDQRSLERRNANRKIPPLTQILAVSDIHDSLASHRSYKRAFTRDEIEREIRGQFTGDIVYIDQVLRRCPIV